MGQKVKIFSARAELTVLRGLFHLDRTVSGTIIASVDESYFYREEGQEIFNLAKTILNEEGKLPKYKIFLDDPDLSDNAKEYLRESQHLLQDQEDAKRAVRVLNKYRKRRGLHSIAHTIDQALQDPKTKIPQLEEDISQALVQVKSVKSQKDAFLIFGKNNNSNEFIEDLLYGEDNDSIIPTGWRTFDDRNGGLGRGSLVTVGANSGGGKSQFAVSLAKNIASMGYKVLIVPLEMSKKEMSSRLVANVAQEDSLNITLKRVEDPDKVYRKYKNWVKKLKAKKGQLLFFKPEADLTIDEIFASISSYAVDVVIIDYISLLKGVDGDDQWRQLGAACRYAKINAELANRVNIMLCQVSDEGKIRYAGAIREHCVSGDTLIDTNLGLVRIDSLYPNAVIASTKPLISVKVKSEGAYREASHIHYNGVRDIYEVRLESGHVIRCTGQHRFRYLSDKGSHGWVRLKDLRVGDHVQIDHGNSYHPKKHQMVSIPDTEGHHNLDKLMPARIKVDENFAYILGCTSSDGYVGKYNYQFIASDKKILDKFVKCWHATFGVDTCTVVRKKTPAGVPIWRVHAKVDISEFFRSITGMEGHAPRKYAPDIILTASESVVCSYLAGVFDGDGSFSRNVGSLCTVSKEQQNRVRLLLNRIGIVTNKKTLIITGDNLVKFIKKVPVIVTKRVKVVLKNMHESHDVLPNFLITTPLVHDRNQKSLRLKQLSQEATSVIDKLRHMAGAHYQNGKLSRVHYKNLQRAHHALKNSYLSDRLTEVLAYSKFARYSPIVSIVKVGKERVYDLTVPETENYVANGIVVHNSSNAFIWTANQDTKEQGIIKVEQLKSRTQHGFPFTLGIDYSTSTLYDLDDYTNPDAEEQEPAKGKKDKSKKSKSSVNKKSKHHKKGDVKHSKSKRKLAPNLADSDV